MTSHFYFPANVNLFSRDPETNKLIPDVGYEGWWEDLIEDINSAVDEYTEDMSDFINEESFEQKVSSIRYSIILAGEDGCDFYGKVTFEHHTPLTAEEILDVKEWISGQNSDGVGEGLEIQEYETNGYVFKVELWDSRNPHLYKVYTEKEWGAMMNDL